jgi:serine/threonine-protein kinase
MGHVFAARHVELGHLVAIKVIRPSTLEDRERFLATVERFKREARAVAALRSDHVVRIHDVGETDDGLPYMIMEYLEGRDLGSILVEGGPLPVHEALTYMIQVCHALAEAHDAGIIHRDLKPQNFFVGHASSGEPHVRVLDFGVAKAVRGTDVAQVAEERQITVTGALIGTPQFMAPEQVMGKKEVDARVDIWGVGVCLYQLLTGTDAYGAVHPNLVSMKILREEPRPLRSLRADASPAVEAIVARCLKKKPAERFASVRELLSALVAAREELSAAGAPMQTAPRTPHPPSLGEAMTVPVTAPLVGVGVGVGEVPSDAETATREARLPATDPMPPPLPPHLHDRAAPKLPAAVIAVVGGVLLFAATIAVVRLSSPRVQTAGSITAPPQSAAASASAALGEEASTAAPVTTGGPGSSIATRLDNAADESSAESRATPPARSLGGAAPSAVARRQQPLAPATTSPHAKPSCKIVPVRDSAGRTTFHETCTP